MSGSFIISKTGNHGLRALFCAFAVVLIVSQVKTAEAYDLRTGEAVISVDTSGTVTGISFVDDTTFSSGTRTAIGILESGGETLFPSAVQFTSDSLDITFADATTARFSISPHQGFCLFELTDLDLKSSPAKMQLLRLGAPKGARFGTVLNTGFFDGKAIGLMAASTEVLPYSLANRSRSADLDNCFHRFTQTTKSKFGNHAAEFSATCTLKQRGWSMHGLALKPEYSWDDIAGLSAWIYGDGKGQSLKFQLIDENGGARDYYVPIDFTGWRNLEMTSAALEIRRSKKVTGLNLYFNGIPGETNVTCLIDNIRVITAHREMPQNILLEDFEDGESPWWEGPSTTFAMEWDFDYAGVGDGFAVIACSEKDYFQTVQQFEKSAGIIAPYLDGQWNKLADAVKQSYVFLTRFSEKEFEDALALAKQGGFKMVLLGQGSWCQSTGHYKINRSNFPDGLASLVRTVKRFRAEGIDVGLHLLGASINWNDPYLTPKPDPRLVKDALTTLTKGMDAFTTSIIVDSMPEGFPAEDGGYTGDGTVLQIGSELIQYNARTTTSPYTFTGCKRGHLGTTATAHQAGAAVEHLARSYNYHMFDMDSSLLDEVTSNFAAVANACDIGMVYFDGSERLQGDHRRYNPRLINAYVSKLNRKDILLQASSFAHYSWHQLCRTASADGHGDLKGYLEQRSPGFESFERIGIPLDIGWYYGYDTSATPDMYEYILGATIGYDSSFSFQVSVDAAKKHPFTDEILDLINRYEKLRLSGRVDQQMRERLRVVDLLKGKAPEDDDRLTSARREYRLIRSSGSDAFQRVFYGEWQTGEDAETGMQWNIDLASGSAAMGFQLQALPDSAGENVTNPWIEIDGRRIEWPGIVAAGQYLFLWPGENATLHGLPLKKAHQSNFVTPTIQVPAGMHRIRFGAAPGSHAGFRVRTTHQPKERHIIPGGD